MHGIDADVLLAQRGRVVPHQSNDAVFGGVIARPSEKWRTTFVVDLRARSNTNRLSGGRDLSDCLCELFRNISQQGRYQAAEGRTTDLARDGK